MQTTTVASQKSFAFALFEVLARQPRNLVFSPLSIWTALALVTLGATGETLRALLTCLRVDGEEALLAEARQLLQLPSERPWANEGDDLGLKEAIKLEIANAVWADDRAGLKDAYLQQARSAFDAEIQVADFEDAEHVASAINAWIHERTHGLIGPLIAPAQITPLVRAVLANAVYFKVRWESPFEAEHTRAGRFAGAARTTWVWFMRQELYARYRLEDGVQHIELPYINGELAMELFVPETGQPLPSPAGWRRMAAGSWLQGAHCELVDLRLPKLKVERTLDLIPGLTRLGAEPAFAPETASFQRISDEAGFHVGGVVHGAQVELDEEGTEAAAATLVAVAGAGLSARPKPIPVWFDRPFYWLIRDEPTGAILFMGRIEGLDEQRDAARSALLSALRWRSGGAARS